jgi:hypothetical protein
MSIAIKDRLAKSDPGNAKWQRDLSATYEKLGDLQLRLNDVAAAMVSFKADLAIADRLAKVETGNGSLQRDLAVSYAKLAEVYLKAKQVSQAQEALADGRAIIAQLIEQHPDASQWRQDLDWFDKRIAAVTAAH